MKGRYVSLNFSKFSPCVDQLSGILRIICQLLSTATILDHAIQSLDGKMLGVVKSYSRLAGKECGGGQ